jgi:hypothetical protein
MTVACHACRAQTNCVEMLVIRGWKLHLPLCLPCMLAWTERSGEKGSLCPPIHHAPFGLVLRALFLGRVVWALSDEE